MQIEKFDFLIAIERTQRNFSLLDFFSDDYSHTATEKAFDSFEVHSNFFPMEHKKARSILKNCPMQ